MLPFYILSKAAVLLSQLCKCDLLFKLLQMTINYTRYYCIGYFVKDALFALHGC